MSDSLPLDELFSDDEDISHLASPISLGAKVFPNFRLRAQAKTISDAVVDAITGRGPRFVAISIPQQFGKLLALDTPIPTPSGWTTMGDIQVGDVIFDEFGAPTKVVAATPVEYDAKCYRMAFDDGEQIIAGADHLWKVADERGDRSHVLKLRTTKELTRRGWSSPRVDNAAPLQLPAFPLPIDPYVLGVWLGDGTSASNYFTKKNAEDAAEIVPRMEQAGYTIRALKNGTWSIDGLKPVLRVLDLLDNKHIPAIYLRSSEEQRWALLQGLIDTDGYVDPKGIVEFCTTREALAEGTEELLHSLGIKVMVKKGVAKIYGREIGPKWRLFFYHPNAAYLTRKRERCREPVRQKHRYIRSVVEIPSVPLRCIQVEAKSGMYLCGRGMVPTHNSFLTSICTPLWVLELHALGALPGGLVALMSFEDSLAQSWSIKIRREIEAQPDMFYSTLRKDSRAASYWETQQGGGILAIGTAGSVQGRPVTLLGIDDPTKNFDQAMSPKHQNKLWDNWNTVLYGRLQPWTVVLVTMVRWAPDDFIGRLTSADYEGDPADWRYIEIPYVCESDNDPLGREIGEPLLRPQSDQTLEQAKEEAARIRATVSTYSWNTLWQQQPKDDAGTIFPESKFRYWGADVPTGHEDERYDLPEPDDFDIVIMSWDMAFKDERHHDWVVGQLWGARLEDRYLIDQVRGHWGFTETCSRVADFAQRSRAKYRNARTVLVEDKANGTGIIDVLRSKVGGLIPVNPEESKTARAWSCQPILLGGNLYVPARSRAAWVPAYTKEMSEFRGEGSAHDDQVDATTQALRHLMFYQYEPSTIETADEIDLSTISML